MSIEVAKCPLCDPYQYMVYAAVHRATVPEECEVFHPRHVGWIECPLCFATGEVPKELSSAFLLTRGKLSPMNDTRPHYDDLVTLRKEIFKLLQKGGVFAY